MVCSVFFLYSSLQPVFRMLREWICSTANVPGTYGGVEGSVFILYALARGVPANLSHPFPASPFDMMQHHQLVSDTGSAFGLDWSYRLSWGVGDHTISGAGSFTTAHLNDPAVCTLLHGPRLLLYNRFSTRFSRLLIDATPPPSVNVAVHYAKRTLHTFPATEPCAFHCQQHIAADIINFYCWLFFRWQLCLPDAVACTFH